MFTWNIMIFLWILAAFICAGFGWQIGAWLASKLFR